MAENLIMGGCCFLNHFLHFILLMISFTCFHSQYCFSYQVRNGGPYTFSSFNSSKIQLKPYQWRYIRVFLPPLFSSMRITLESNVDLDHGKIKKFKRSRLPVICLREGGPPLPDVYNDFSGLVLDPVSNGSLGNEKLLHNAELCYPMQKNINLKLTSEQILPGIWYWGFFNGIGPARTQSKMINRGKAYSFSANVSIERCKCPTLGGQNCDQTLHLLSCPNRSFFTGNFSDMKSNPTIDNVLSCTNSDGTSCLRDNEPKIYAVNIGNISEQVTIRVTNVKFSGSGMFFKCYARYGAIPLANLYDYSSNISEGPLVIPSPKIGQWYIAIHLMNTSSEGGGAPDTNIEACYSLYWQVFQCPEGKAGLNCTSERCTLQTVQKNPSDFFASTYMPTSGRISSNLATFPLEPFFRNSSYNKKSDFAWTYFLLNVPNGASGGNLHIQLASSSKINYEIYAKYMGLPSLDSWDYFYVNRTSNSYGSMFFKLYDASEETVDFYILYVREGTWSLGLKQLNPGGSVSKNQTTMLVSIEKCPKSCAHHGTCKTTGDVSGSPYSFCDCDRDHGGFDCGVTIVSRLGHILQSIFLIGSNAAALLPACWSLRQKAYADWILFMCSGISSAIYHACDVGTWCALSFHVLQFMDFWLSFMAAVSTFLFMTDIGEAYKRAIQTVIAIITVLMVENERTKSSKISHVLEIGALGLLVGWLIEFVTRFRSLSFSRELRLDILNRWRAVKAWLRILIKTIVKRFCWGFLVAACFTLAMAALSWELESTESYWFWHSLWHVSIYTSSFLFLYSKAIPLDGVNQRVLGVNYELTRQDSSPRGG